jgi:hypothetical protein
MDSNEVRKVTEAVTDKTENMKQKMFCE